MAATIKDIALEAGISCQAVSAVLNGKTNCRVSPERRETIFAIAKHLGYQPNFAFKLMRKKQTCTVGIITAMRQIESEEHMHLVVLLLMQRFNEIGYASYFNNLMTQDASENLRQIQDLITRGVEHFIFIGTPYGHVEIEEELKRQNKTFIGLKSLFSRNLHVDSVGSSEIILNFLRKQAGDAIKLVLPAAPNPKLTDRFKALCRTYPDRSPDELLRDHVIATPALQWVEQDFNACLFEFGYQGTADAFAQPERPKGIFYLSDNYALGGAVYCHDHDIKVGHDVFLAGFNNIEAVKFHPLPIASVEQPIAKIIEILLREARSKETFSETLKQTIFLRPEIK